MFQIPETTAVRCTNANPRTELHGKDEEGNEKRVRAIDLTFEFTTENTVLDEIEPGLREHFYRNKAADASQKTLPDVVIPLPDIRFPQLKTEDIRWEQPKARGYRWVWDWGREEQHVDLTDVAAGSLTLSLIQGGATKVKFSISYNGDQLEDNTLYGELCGLPTMGEAHIQLFAPGELVPVKKGWRSGKADEPERTDGGAPLLEEGRGGEGAAPDGPLPAAGEDGFAEGSPEGALADAIAGDADAQESPPASGVTANTEAAWPFPRSAHEQQPEQPQTSEQQYPAPPMKRGRGRRASAAA